MQWTGSFSIKGDGEFGVVSVEIFVVEHRGLADGDA